MAVPEYTTVLVDGLDLTLSWLNMDILVDFMEVSVEVELDYIIEMEYCVSE